MGHRFINRVQLAVARVEAMPRIGAPSSSRYPEVRRYAFRGFPHYVVYATEPMITVNAVVHTKRRSGSGWIGCRTERERDWPLRAARTFVFKAR